MQEVLIQVMYLSIVCLFVEGWLVVRNMRAPLHFYLFLSCLATMINNIGYVLELQSTTEAQYITALKFSYAGRTWIALTLFLVAANLCKLYIPGWLKGIAALFYFSIYWTVLHLESTNLYYASYEFVIGGDFPILRHTNGIVHHLFVYAQLFFIILGIGSLILSIKKQKGHTAKRRIKIVVTAFLVEGVFFVVQIFGLLDITRTFDVTMLGNVIGTLILFIAIFRYNLLGVIDAAKEVMIDRLSEGIIAVDTEGDVQYFNDPAGVLFPDIRKNPDGAVTLIKETIERGETLTIGEKIYKPDETEIKHNGEEFGKLYALVDATVLKQNEMKAKADAEILEIAATNMKERLLASEELARQDRAMRHDRRHFEALLLTLINDGNVEEARKCLEERMEQEPRMAKRYCDNTTVNAAIAYYADLAMREDIRVNVSANIPVDPGVDEMQLAIAVSNLIENAIHACRKVPKEERHIDIKARFKDQLLLEIANSHDGSACLNTEGHPVTEMEGHGIGTRSVLAFASKTDSEIRYVVDDKLFKVRMIIGT
ncbi:MAG: GHKL domain-containing protein [Lachnospiraceae bacterium]|nr:GHKL domain-containing protein [Lachnospiraceae bacterium]